jgi:hypothetical protein
MISYELAKQMKDAGFPQTEFEVFCKHGCPPFNEHGEGRPLQCGECHLNDLVYTPTLEELIEACGDHFIRLEKSEHGWSSLGWWPKGEETTTGRG